MGRPTSPGPSRSTSTPSLRVMSGTPRRSAAPSIRSASSSTAPISEPTPSPSSAGAATCSARTGRSAMRQLFPVVVDPVDPYDVYADVPVVAGRPGVRLNMIASLDGATSVDGLSGALGGPATPRVFSVLPWVTDFVLVAAGTMGAEG